jgi:hypothetical protein|nr:MAG TPA: hypothetical protein [Caudoviricetes sp.]
MQKTENLQLNIIEGTDVPSHAVFNENFNKLDEFARTMNDTNVSLKNRMETLETEVDVKITDLEKNFDDTVLVLEDKISEVELDVDGETKKGKLKRLVIKTTPAYNSFYHSIPYVDTANNVIYDVSEKRCLITSYSGYGSINMTELIGLTDVKDIMLLGTQMYSDKYMLVTTGNSNTVPMDCYSLQKLTYPGAGDDIYLSYSGSSTSFTLQEYKGSTSGGWQPSITSATPVSDVYIVVNYVEFNK